MDFAVRQCSAVRGNKRPTVVAVELSLRQSNPLGATWSGEDGQVGGEKEGDEIGERESECSEGGPRKLLPAARCCSNGGRSLSGQIALGGGVN